ncbi:MAG: hypothetical protein ACI9O6_000227 [Glaciecola sp.]|jgi:hypothetical protein
MFQCQTCFTISQLTISQLTTSQLTTSPIIIAKATSIRQSQF